MKLLVFNNASIPVVAIVKESIYWGWLEPGAASDVAGYEPTKNSKSERQEGTCQLEAGLSLRIAALLENSRILPSEVALSS
jgi:hypothetical protein